MAGEGEWGKEEEMDLALVNLIIRLMVSRLDDLN